MASCIAAAARGDAAQAAFDRKISHCRNEIGELRQQGIQYRPPVRPLTSPEHFSTRQTSPPVETGSICRRNPFIAGGNTTSKSFSCVGGPTWHAQFSRILQRGQSGSSQASSTEPCTTNDMSTLSTAGLVTTTSTTLRLTQQYQTTVTLTPQRAARMNLCSSQVSNCPVCSLAIWVCCRLTVVLPRNVQDPQGLRPVSLFDNLHLKDSFEDNGVSGQQVLDLFLALEDDVFQRCLSAQPDPTALQRSNRGKGALLLRDLDATVDLPPHCSLLALQLLDLTHRRWSKSEGPDIEEENVYALAAAARQVPRPSSIPASRSSAALAGCASSCGRTKEGVFAQARCTRCCCDRWSTTLTDDTVSGVARDVAAGAAKRKRDRRHRTFWRHELRAVRMATLTPSLGTEEACREPRCDANYCDIWRASTSDRIRDTCTFFLLRNTCTCGLVRASSAGCHLCSTCACHRPPARVAPSGQCPPAYTMGTVTTRVNLDISGLVNPQFSTTSV